MKVKESLGTGPRRSGSALHGYWKSERTKAIGKKRLAWRTRQAIPEGRERRPSGSSEIALETLDSGLILRVRKFQAAGGQTIYSGSKRKDNS